jgi:large subunit ribosomal protein L10
MAKEVKGLITDELKSRLEGLDGLVMVDTTGLDAHQAEAFRRELREANLQMLVVKNSLARRALEDVGLGPAGECIQGPTAILFGEDGPLAISRILTPWRRKNKLLPVRGGWIGGRVLDAPEVDRLATIPERPVLLAMLCSGLQGVMRNLHFALGGPGRNFAALIKAVAAKKEKEGKEG